MIIKQLSLVIILATLFVGLVWGGLALAEIQPISSAGNRLINQLEDQKVQPSPIFTKANAPSWSVIVGEDDPVLRLQEPYPYFSYNSADLFFPPYPSASERMGYDRTGDFDPTVLNAGWYMDWSARSNPPRYNGVEYGRTIYFNHGLP